MRLLLADPPAVSSVPVGVELDELALVRLYTTPPEAGPWLRVNFAASVDGSITGADGRSGTVNSEVDHVVFELLRALSDAVVVGAGTIRGEGYGALSVAEHLAPVRAGAGLAPDLPLVVVSGQGVVPDTVRGFDPGRVLLATTSSAPGLDEAREVLGEDHVLVCGRTHVGHERLVAQLHERGRRRLLSEGGPHLLSSMVQAGVVDEICLSVTPVVVGGDGPRITQGPALSGDYLPRVLVEGEGTVMGRWLRSDHR